MRHGIIVHWLWTINWYGLLIEILLISQHVWFYESLIPIGLILLQMYTGFTANLAAVLRSL